MKLDYQSPIIGKHLDISYAPDDTFSRGMLGCGFVIFPEDDKIYSPIDGIISLVFPTKHAIAVKHVSGINILIHLGFGTVDLKGEGINIHVKLHDEIKKGDLLVQFDKPFLERNAISTATPVVFLQKEKCTILNEDVSNQRIQLELDIE
ncbi:MAG: PTS glucose transporter subunit IIA [Acholeplasmataceae bacterium]|nr:PTS glucose transporter subunit IIA [Acholeplasmataceae bacterium]